MYRNFFPSRALHRSSSPTNFPTHNGTSQSESLNSNNSGLKKKPPARTQTSLTISQDSKEKKGRPRQGKRICVYIACDVF